MNPVFGEVGPAKPLRVGYSEFAPYVLTAPGGEPTGFGVEILRRIAASRGYELTFERTNNPKETLALLRRGAIDATTLLGWSEERDDFADSTTPVEDLSISLFATTASSISDLAELAGKRIGVVAGSNARGDAERAVFDAKIVAVRNMPALLGALVSGAVDAAAIPEGPFRALLRKADLTEHVGVVEALRIHEMRFLVGEGQVDLLAELNASIDALSRGSELKVIHERWFGRDKRFLERQNVRVALSASGLALLSLSVGVGIAWRANRRAHRSLAELSANRPMIDALNCVDVIVIVWDHHLRPLHWNKATEAQFPDLVPLLREGLTFGEFIERSHLSCDTASPQTAEDLDALVGILEHDLLAGRTEPRLVRSPNGSVFEAIDFKVGTEMYASVRKDVTRQEERASQERLLHHARLEALFENAAVGLAQVSFDGRILAANGTLASLLGVPAQTLSGTNFCTYVNESDRPALEEHVVSAIAEDDRKRHSEVRMHARNGRTVWTSVSLSKVAKNSQQPGYLVVCAQDVTERREIEDQRTILLGELSHRVKNILAVVQTITMQTLRNAKASVEAREKVFIRLRALSAAHDVVFRSTDQDIESVLRAQLGPFEEAGAMRIITAGPRILLPVDLVYALGLIVHELITNAVKYGALSTETGRIDVDWSLEGSTMHLVWRETGGPVTAPPENLGFGSRLIRQMIAHTRSGSVDFDFRPEGLVVGLTVALED